MPQKRLTFDDDAEDDDEDEPAGPDMAGVGSVVGSGRLVGVVFFKKGHFLGMIWAHFGL